ncbi:MAG TPA: UBP-type zinc finger domain-containing protein [Candidatus Limnocylindrales bacterium]|nr:UBP-type zinc finger domain-containing protein [Candidatus Limnocylindrales bacterium]
MKATCSHLIGLGAVPPPRDVCETCMRVGGTWVHLRQCLGCGLTGCCDDSPNQHASHHAHDAGHAVFRSAEAGEDWSWCVVDEATLRREADGSWSEIDTFFEAGLWYAQQVAADSGTVEPAPDATMDDGFPLGTWASTYRARQRDGVIDPEQAKALEALPGWTW